MTVRPPATLTRPSERSRSSTFDHSIDRGSFVLGQIDQGHRHFSELWRNGGAARFERKMRWLDSNRVRLGEAVMR